LPRDVRERRAHATARRELRDEHCDLLHDAADEKARVHDEVEINARSLRSSDG
jgi:hypothetical protein